MLLSVTSIVPNTVILNRMASVIDPYLCKEQAGFRKGKSYADEICSLRQILEQCNEWDTHLYANFIDFAKAFNLTVHTPSSIKDDPHALWYHQQDHLYITNAP